MESRASGAKLWAISNPAIVCHAPFHNRDGSFPESRLQALLDSLDRLRSTGSAEQADFAEYALMSFLVVLGTRGDILCSGFDRLMSEARRGYANNNLFNNLDMAVMSDKIRMDLLNTDCVLVSRKRVAYPVFVQHAWGFASAGPATAAAAVITRYVTEAEPYFRGRGEPPGHSVFTTAHDALEQLRALAPSIDSLVDVGRVCFMQTLLTTSYYKSILAKYQPPPPPPPSPPPAEDEVDYNDDDSDDSDDEEVEEVVEEVGGGLLQHEEVGSGLLQHTALAASAALVAPAAPVAPAAFAVSAASAAQPAQAFDSHALPQQRQAAQFVEQQHAQQVSHALPLPSSPLPHANSPAPQQQQQQQQQQGQVPPSQLMDLQISSTLPASQLSTQPSATPSQLSMPTGAQFLSGVLDLGGPQSSGLAALHSQNNGNNAAAALAPPSPARPHRGHSMGPAAKRARNVSQNAAPIGSAKWAWRSVISASKEVHTAVDVLATLHEARQGSTAESLATAMYNVCTTLASFQSLVYYFFAAYLSQENISQEMFTISSFLAALKVACLNQGWCPEIVGVVNGLVNKLTVARDVVWRLDKIQVNADACVEQVDKWLVVKDDEDDCTIEFAHVNPFIPAT